MTGKFGVIQRDLSRHYFLFADNSGIKDDKGVCREQSANPEALLMGWSAALASKQPVYESLAEEASHGTTHHRH
jgi:hypothetical protein